VEQTPPSRLPGHESSDSTHAATIVVAIVTGSTAETRFEHADACALPFQDESFDAVVCTQVYEYVQDIAKALSELVRVLRPSARALVLDTDWDSIVWHSGDPCACSACWTPGRSTSSIRTCRAG
jgi:SAM-dependent methyltransferase